MRRLVLSGLWLAFLMAYIVLGVPLASYHGDETTQLYSSHDYATLFIKRDPAALLVEWPIDSELEYLRIADSTTSRYTVGLAWHLAGYDETDLPGDNFRWGASWNENVARGLIPPPDLRVIMRLPSAIFLALSAAAIFGIGCRFGGLPVAFFVSGLYALNPVVLLNGRRALQEGSLLFFGLLTILIAVEITLRRERGGRVPLLLWAGLIIAGALAFVSKNNAFLYVIPAFLWIFMPELLRPRLRSLLSIGVKLAISGVLLIALFVALSPGLWSNPPARLQDAAAARLSAMRGQMSDDPDAPSTMARRVEDIFTQPFVKPALHSEPGYGSLDPAQRPLIDLYEGSLLSGIHFGVLLGVPLTVLAVFGIIANFLPRLRPYRSSRLALGMVMWLLVNVVVLLWLPLPWQRYFLSLIPVMTIFAAVGLWSVVGLLRRAAPSA